MYIALTISPDKEDVHGFGTFNDHETAENYAVTKASEYNKLQNSKERKFTWMVLFINQKDYEEVKTNGDSNNR